MNKDYVEIVEWYNKKGVCVKREVNGIPIPPDKEPSIVILNNANSITTHSFIRKEEAKNRYNYKS